MKEEILKALYEPFDVKERRGVGNKMFKYVPAEDIVDRMNRVFKGQWSTKVHKTEIIEDQILICVRVCVVTATDGEKSYDQEFCQDGYASQQLMRYTSGQNSGKIMDIGNAYKSAMSKAIKTAVSKWGVGLYLESDDIDDNAVSDIPSFTTTTPQRISANTSNIPKSTSSMIGPPIDGASVPNPVEVKQNKPSVIPVPPVGGIPTGPPVSPPMGGGSTFKNHPPMFTVENNNTGNDSSGFDIPSSGSTGIEKITDVQRVAVETLMNVHNISFNDLLNKALKRTDNLPTALDTISYLDAVTIIQYGNNLRQI